MILESKYSYDSFSPPDIISQGVDNQKIELLKRRDIPSNGKFIIEFKEATYNDVVTHSIIKRVMLDIQPVQPDSSQGAVNMPYRYNLPSIFDCDYASFSDSFIDIIKDDTVEIDWV